jgi:hypothetical protein
VTVRVSRLATIGAGPLNSRAEMSIIKEDSFWNKDADRKDTENLWLLPRGPNNEHVTAITNEYHFSNDAMYINNCRVLAPMRYTGESRTSAEVAAHPDSGGNNAQVNSGSGRGAPSIPGTWSQSPPEPAAEVDSPVSQEVREDEWHFVANIDRAVIGEFLVGLAEENTGENSGRKYLFVGLITVINKRDGELTMKPYKCTKDPWTKKAYEEGNWHYHSGTRTETIKKESVITYFDKLLKNAKFPAKVKGTVKNSRTGLQ